MMTESFNLRFQPGVVPPSVVSEKDMWFVFSGNKLLVKINEDKVSVLSRTDLKVLDLDIKSSHYIGSLDGQPCYSAELTEGELHYDGLELRELRPLIGVLEDEVFSAAGRAFQIINWDRTHQYCGRCGTPTYTKEDERAKVCPKCGMMSYPRISPAVIVAVVKGESILLAHNKQFRPGLYSVIAGFVEPGETFEECVAREVQEETGIKVKNVRYFGSQPWPFPHSVMVAFTAEYESEEIAVDGIEISEAGWFNPAELPEVPTNGSIARKLIDWFLETWNQ